MIKNWICYRKRVLFLLLIIVLGLLLLSWCGTVCLFGDYKLTVNITTRLDTYPIPTLDDLFSEFSCFSVCSNLDMSQAYAQLCLDKESKKYTVINTHHGLFKFNRLSFGISSAPGILNEV